MLKLMKKYTAAFSVTGREWHLAEIIEKDIAPYVDTVTKDALGNLIAFKKGLDSTKRVMVAAHMDEIGFIVTGIDEKGYVRVHNLGGIPATADMYTKVVFENGLRGVLVPDQSTKAGDVTIKKLVIDIGARSRKDAEKKVKIGDVCALECSFVRLMNNRFAAKAFDDRLGCAVAVKAASLVGTPAYDTYYVFTVQEEVGCRGSRTAAFTIAPTFGIAIDVTSTGDTVDTSEIPEGTHWGDVNVDSYVNIADVVALNMYLIGPDVNPVTKQGLINANVAYDDYVNTTDGLTLMNYVAMVIEYEQLGPQN